MNIVINIWLIVDFCLSLRLTWEILLYNISIRGHKRFQFFWVWVGFGLGLVLNFEKRLVMVWFCFVSNNFVTFFSNFFSNFLKNIKIQYKNTFNETKIKISENLMFKNNNNIIFGQFESILCSEIFKCLVLGLGCVEKSQFGLGLNFPY
jgi:hypothetical protein